MLEEITIQGKIMIITKWIYSSHNIFGWRRYFRRTKR